MNCKNCGRPLNEGAKFCPGCGRKVEPPTQEDAVAEKVEKKTKKPPLIPILAAVLVLAVCVGGWYIWSRQSGQGASAPEDVSAPVEEMTDAPTPEEDLAECLRQVEELDNKRFSDFSAINSTDDPDDPYGFGQAASLFENYLTDLSELQKKADAINGLDAKLREAKDAYFLIQRDSYTANAECFAFYRDFSDFESNIIDQQPQLGDFSSGSEYAAALYEWTQKARDAYAGMSYPVCLEHLWNRYGELFVYPEAVVEKLGESASYSDNLRLQSALNIVGRYNILQEKLRGQIAQCVATGNSGHATSQMLIAADLLEEMRTYIDATAEEREAFEFQHIRAGEVVCDFDAIETIYPSLYNSYDAFVVIKAGCVSGSRTIMVEAEIPGFTQPYRESFQLGPAYTELYIKPPALAGEIDLTAAKSAQLTVFISEMDGTPISAKSFPVELKSKYDFEWYSDEYGTATQDNILCFLTPESSAITTLKRQAIDEISAMTGGVMEAFVGYQNVYSNHLVNTYFQAAGLMCAMHDLGIRYNMNPFSISGSNQHILLPEDVIEQRSGLCVETSLVIASALQSANMHAFLIFPPGHAQVAVEVWNRGNYKGEYFLIETTALDGDNRAAFLADADFLSAGQRPTSGIITYLSKSEWNEYLEAADYNIVDCDDSRLLGLTPFAN